MFLSNPSMYRNQQTRMALLQIPVSVLRQVGACTKCSWEWIRSPRTFEVGIKIRGLAFGSTLALVGYWYLVVDWSALQYLEHYYWHDLLLFGSFCGLSVQTYWDVVLAFDYLQFVICHGSRPDCLDIRAYLFWRVIPRILYMLITEYFIYEYSQYTFTNF